MSEELINTFVPGSKWRHHNGILYSIVVLTNVGSTDNNYPPTVVYIGPNGKAWSRPVSEWSRSFTRISE